MMFRYFCLVRALIPIFGGGDIDLFVRDSTGKPLKIRNKINFITDLILQIGDQRIDVVLDNNEAKNSVFFKTIE